jgi:hypothetical protein
VLDDHDQPDGVAGVVRADPRQQQRRDQHGGRHGQAADEQPDRRSGVDGGDGKALGGHAGSTPGMNR